MTKAKQPVDNTLKNPDFQFPLKSRLPYSNQLEQRGNSSLWTGQAFQFARIPPLTPLPWPWRWVALIIYRGTHAVIFLRPGLPGSILLPSSDTQVLWYASLMPGLWTKPLSGHLLGAVVGHKIREIYEIHFFRLYQRRIGVAPGSFFVWLKALTLGRWNNT